MSHVPDFDIPDSDFAMRWRAATGAGDGEWGIRLESYESKIPAIKAVRSICDLGLREAKDIVDGKLPALLPVRGPYQEMVNRVLAGRRHIEDDMRLRPDTQAPQFCVWKL